MDILQGKAQNQSLSKDQTEQGLEMQKRLPNPIKNEVDKVKGDNNVENEDIRIPLDKVKTIPSYLARTESEHTSLMMTKNSLEEETEEDSSSSNSNQIFHSFTSEEKRVILASSLGTLFEWYDFYLIAVLATPIKVNFYSDLSESSAYLFTLLTFAAGFVARPIGAFFFGCFGDLMGRKAVFLTSIIIMGLSTLAVGFIPNFDKIGILAPQLLVTCRLLQGFALGGEYGGAAIYVAEHAPSHLRGFYTSFIQTTASIGLLLSLAVIAITQKVILQGDGAKFLNYGWRYPFYFSGILVLVSVYIRLKMEESPAFLKMKTNNIVSKNPLREACCHGRHFRNILLVLFALVAGQACVWYTAQFYTLFFMRQQLEMEADVVSLTMGIAIVLAAPLYIFFGFLSDKIGRKKVIYSGMALSLLFFFPNTPFNFLEQLTKYGNPELYNAMETNPVYLYIPKSATCDFTLEIAEKADEIYYTSCDIAKAALANNKIPYKTIVDSSYDVVTIKFDDQTTEGNEPVFIESYDVDPEDESLTDEDILNRYNFFEFAVTYEAKQAGYLGISDTNTINKKMIVLFLWLGLIFGTMTYAPLAATIVELFPTSIRYTALSVPYHLANGCIGGFLPAFSFGIVKETGNIYEGTYYTVGFAAFAIFLGMLFLPETYKTDIFQSENERIEQQQKEKKIDNEKLEHKIAGMVEEEKTIEIDAQI